MTTIPMIISKGLPARVKIAIFFHLIRHKGPVGPNTGKVRVGLEMHHPAVMGPFELRPNVRGLKIAESRVEFGLEDVGATRV